jgi:signal recognition particle GTPase
MFEKVDRAAVQDQVCLAVEAEFGSFQGRYVNSDLMKEMFPEYNASRDHRNKYNLPVHNAAAVLASAQFRASIADDSVPERTNVVFLTGVPGAGKTTAVLARSRIGQGIRC